MHREYKFLTHQTLPCWSKLLWTPDPAAISILIHEDIIPIIDALTDQDPRIKYFMQYGSFIREPERWGINGSLIRTPKTEDGFFEFRAALPRVKKFKEDICRECNGKCEDELEFKCFRCYGTGHEVYFDRIPVHAISASLTILTDFINHFPPEQNTSSKQVQLTAPTVHILDRAFPLGGNCSIEFAQWLNSHKDSELVEPTQAVKTAWRMMMGEADDFTDWHLQAMTHDDGRLRISCPGDACEIFCDPMRSEKGRGHTFADHNMDSPIQQLTLLAGLAATETLARQELGC